MARLTSDAWADRRAAWEASPTQGIPWLTDRAGGRWEISEEAIRRRKLAENRQKPAKPSALARTARAAADLLAASRAISAEGPDAGEVSPGSREEREERSRKLGAKLGGIAN